MAEEPQKRFETFTDDFGNEWYDREQVDIEIERLTAALRDLRYRSPLTALDVERICEQALRRSWDYPRSSPDETKACTTCGDDSCGGYHAELRPAVETTTCRIYEYDGAYKCYVHGRQWGAISPVTGPCPGWQPLKATGEQT